MVMDAKTRVAPPGFRFHPTEEELVGYYLRKKIASQKIDFDVIKEIDLYRVEPWDLQDKWEIGYEEQREWYFFSRKYKKYPTGSRTNRATRVGFWKATGRDKAVYDKSEEKIIGMRKTLVFYIGRAPNGHKTDWVMHEYYALHSQNNNASSSSSQEGWVLCRGFKKRIGGREKSKSPAGHHLPPLKSPSSPSSMPPESNKEEEEDDKMSKKKVMSDWRALDKFVASQLSHDNDRTFKYCNVSDVALLSAIADR